MIVALTGLLFVMIGYVVGGASAFMLLERTAATDKKVRYSKPDLARIWMLDKLQHIHTTLQGNATKFHEEAEKIVRRYDQVVAQAVNDGWQYNTTVENEWTYESSILFAASLVTTVGYGHIAPSTSAGRLFTILYSCVGIPLCLVCIGLLGTIMARGFKALALYLFEDSVTEEGFAFIPLKASASVMFIYLFAGAILFRMVGPGWTFLESFYFCFITLSTIGLGDFVYGEDSTRDSSFVASVAYLLLGLSLLSMCFNLMEEQAHYKLYSTLNCLKVKLKKVCGCFF